jgi:nitrous oxidase accessory protein NosD
VKLVLVRTEQTFSSWDALERVLRENDVVIVTGDLQGPLVIHVDGLTLKGRSNTERFTLRAAKNGTTLTLAAHGIAIRNCDIRDARDPGASHRKPTVRVQKGRQGCSLEQCSVIGNLKRGLERAWPARRVRRRSG